MPRQWCSNAPEKSLPVEGVSRSTINSPPRRRLSSRSRPLAAEAEHVTNYTPYVGAVMLVIALVFVWRSFYAMRIQKEA